MKTIRNILLCSSLFMGGCLGAQDPGDAVFYSPAIHDINIIFAPPAFWDSLTLYKDQSDQTGIDQYMPGKVVFNGDTLDSTGVRLKGNSTYGHPGFKKPIKLSFDKYVSGQKYDRLKEIHLNNGAYDPTMLREKLFLDILNANGLAAPRCTFAKVSYNGVYVGLYKIIESVDKTFLKTRFGNNDRNLYKADPYTPLKWEGSGQSAYYDNFELKTNELENDWTDMVSFLNTVNNSGNNFRANMEQAFNIHDYIKTWAAYNLFVNLDTYLYNPHNFYLYNDSIANKFQWISWDVGIVFGVFPMWFQSSQEFDILYLPGNPDDLPLNKFIYDQYDLKNEYLNDMCALMYNDFIPSKLFRKIDSLGNLVRPHIYAEPDDNQMYTEAQFEGNLGYTAASSFLLSQVPGLKSFISQRYKSVESQMCEKGWSCALGASILFTDDLVNIYPNPSSESITVKFAVLERSGSLAYRITDVTGKIFLERAADLSYGLNTHTINTAGMAQGIYFLHVNTGCQDVKKKFVVVR